MEIDPVVKVPGSIHSMRTGGWRMRDPQTVHTIGSNARTVKYEVGDMVWGKVKSHPWWPGQIFEEALASPTVNETKIEGHLLVAFFGDDTFGWFDPGKLIPFDPNYMEKLKQTNAKAFVDAVQHAENEIRRRAALGLSCCCRKHYLNFKVIGVKGFFLVDVEGYGAGAVYTARQIESARDGFQPTEVLCFLKGLALMPCCNLENGVNRVKKEAMILAYRRAVFQEFDETYINSFGAEPQDSSDSPTILALREKLPFEASLSCPPERPQATAINERLSRPTETKKKKYFNKLDISGVHSDKRLPQKENAAVIGDNIMQTRALSAATFSGSLSQHKFNKKFGSTTESQDDTANEATAMNKKPVHRKVSSMNLMVDSEQLPEGPDKVGNLHILQAVDNALPPSGVVSHAKFLVTNCGHGDEQPSIFNQLEKDLTSKEAVTVDKRKRKIEFKLEEGLKSSYKRSKTVKAEASEGSAYGKSCQTGLSCRDNNLLSPPQVDSQEVPPASRPPKKRLRPEDYEMFGQNNSNSCQKEGMPVKRLIKLSKLKSSSTERKVCHQKPPESLPIQDNVRALTDPTKKGKNLIKKHEPSPKAAERTMLVMQFPLKSALPSVPELKAKFSRFGPFDSLPRLFWKSSTCRIIFKYKSDAHIAYRYATGNRSLFSNAMVNCYLHALEVPATEVSKPCKHNVQDQENLDNFPWSGPIETGDSTEKLKPVAPEEQQHLHSTFQPKSCLKKPQSDDLVAGALCMKPRVRFRLSEDQSSSIEQMPVNSNVKKSSINEMGGSSLSCDATVKIPVNWQVLIAQLPPALHPLLNQTTDAVMSNGLDQFVAACNASYEAQAMKNCMYSTPTSPNVVALLPPALHPLLNQTADALMSYGLDQFVAACNARYEAQAMNKMSIYSTSTSSYVDISSQMLNLMGRCSEIVSNLKGWLGYAPIHL